MSAPSTTRRRFPPALIAVAIVVGIAVLAFIWWTVSPLFISTRVDEAFPTSAPVAAVSEAPAVVTQPTEAPAAATQPTEAPAAVTQPTEAPAAATQPTEAPAAVTQPTEAPAAVTQPTEAPAAAPPAVASEPVALAVGSFTDIDPLHGAQGSATIYRLPDGKLLLRFENFNAKNGPDLFVGLSSHPMPRSSAEVHENYVELARLTATQGNQNYELPADLDLSNFQSVVIYCKAFSVVFSTATLGDA